MTNDKDEARLVEKLTKMYNAHCEAKMSMTLASVQMEVKKFWQDRKETEDLMYSRPTNRPGSGQNSERNKERRRRKKSKKKPGSSNIVAQVTGDDNKGKEL